MDTTPVFVPSKNRATTSQLLAFAYTEKYPLTVVVEPQNFCEYKQHYPEIFKFMVLPKDNGGISYVRNYIKQKTEELGYNYYWQLDDDITGIFKRQGTRLLRVGFDALVAATGQFSISKIALGALEYRQFAWSANKPLIENSFCDTCVFVDNELTNGMRYNSYVEGKEDRDFAMQVIKNGLNTGRTTFYAFSAPQNGSNAGGLKEIFYDAGKEKICVERMAEIWPNLAIPITKPDGRNDVKILWDKINSKQGALF